MHKYLGLLFVIAVFACGSPPDERAASSTQSLVTAIGVDYSWARPDPGALHAEGYTFAARYLSHDTSGKTIDAGEANALWGAGVDVVVVWEDGAENALGGYGQGVADAQAADAIAAAAGMPAGRPIYFAVDFDAQAYQQGTIDAYFQGVASVIGLGRTGAYGGYGLVARSFDDGVIAWGWQTYAWSYGNWDARAQLRQTLNGITAAGDGDCCDRDEAQTDDYGQWHANKPPGGFLDGADCAAGVTGWAQDPEAPTTSLNGVLVFDGPVFTAGSQAMTVAMNMSRPDLCNAIGSCEHAFQTPIPLGVLDGKQHDVWAYAFDSVQNGPAGTLWGSGKTFTCPNATPPLDGKTGVLRHVINPDSYAAWKFVALTDVAPEPDAVVATFATGADWSSAPALVQADDGTPEVWIIDGEVRRHVIDPPSFAAWHFGDVQKTPAADVYKYARGLDLPARPFLIQGSGPAIWVLDAAPGTGTSPSGTDDAGTNRHGPNGAEPQAGGCSASGSGGGNGAWLAAIALVLARRRRARASRKRVYSRRSSNTARAATTTRRPPSRACGRPTSRGNARSRASSTRSTRRATRTNGSSPRVRPKRRTTRWPMTWRTNRCSTASRNGSLRCPPPSVRPSSAATSPTRSRSRATSYAAKSRTSDASASSARRRSSTRCSRTR